MICTSCGTKNPDEARFCMKCGAAVVTRAPASAAIETAAPAAVAPKPVSTPQPPKTNAGGKPVTPPPAKGKIDVDRVVAMIAVGAGSLLLALILAGIGYHTMQAETQACTAAVMSGAGQSSCYNSGFWSFFLAAFAVAGGGLKMASRIGKK